VAQRLEAFKAYTAAIAADPKIRILPVVAAFLGAKVCFGLDGSSLQTHGSKAR